MLLKDLRGPGLGLLVGGVVAALLLDSEAGQLHAAGFGLVASILTVVVVIGAGGDLPDRAIGVAGGRLPTNVQAVPVVALGWLLAGIGALAALLVGGLEHALFALLLGAVGPLALARSLSRFLARFAPRPGPG